MKIRYKFHVNASAEYLFNLTQDYKLRNEWDPSMSDAFVVDFDKEPKKGKLVRCIAKNGLSMDTIFTAFKPGKVAVVELTDGPFIFDTFVGGWQFKAVDSNNTIVGFNYDIETKPKFLSWFLTPIVCYFFRLETKKRISALTKYAESRYSCS